MRKMRDRPETDVEICQKASTTSIYAMRSLGIDPQTGKEMFISKDGTVGNKWIASENVAVGNTEPKINILSPRTFITGINS
ncbi:MAG: hypothetical protein ACLU4J_02680 [Butyricimonas paravirosa]